jgi:hypothetical protein
MSRLQQQASRASCAENRLVQQSCSLYATVLASFLLPSYFRLTAVGATRMTSSKQPSAPSLESLAWWRATLNHRLVPLVCLDACGLPPQFKGMWVSIRHVSKAYYVICNIANLIVYIHQRLFCNSKTLKKIICTINSQWILNAIQTHPAASSIIGAGQ